MGLRESWTQFKYRLPDTLNDFRELRSEFGKIISDTAKEGAEIFTVGFHEMVIKNNDDWKSSFENRTEAERLVADVGENFPELQEEIEIQREKTLASLDRLEDVHNSSTDYLGELGEFAECILGEDLIPVCLMSLSLHAVVYRPAVENIAELTRGAFRTEEGRQRLISLPVLDNPMSRNHKSKRDLEEVHRKVDDYNLVRSILEDELMRLQSLNSSSKRAIALLEFIEKSLADSLNCLEAINNAHCGSDGSVPDETQEAIEGILDYAMQVRNVLGIEFLDSDGVMVSRAFQAMLEKVAVPLGQAGQLVVAALKEAAPVIPPLYRSELAQKNDTYSANALRLVRQALKMSSADSHVDP